MCEQKYQYFLYNLKATVEGLFVGQITNVWSIYGGLNRLHTAMEKIFTHGYKKNSNTNAHDNNNSSIYWEFVKGLEWLQPNSTLVIDAEYKSHMPHHIKHSKESIWLYSSLESHSLSQKLSWLLSDQRHLTDWYQPQAFLCQKKYAESVLICLRAVERNQPSLVSEIDPCLFLNKDQEHNSCKRHKRGSSFPHKHFIDLHNNISFVANKRMLGKLKPWSSMPNLITKKPKPVEGAGCNSVPTTPIHKRYYVPPTKNLTYSNTPEPEHILINSCDIIEYSPSNFNGSLDNTLKVSLSDLANLSFKSLPEMPYSTTATKSPFQYGFVRTLSGEKDYRRKPKKTFIEDGGMSILPMSTGYFPKPSKGQTLTAFLTCNQFAHTNAELDRENAHFSISEAIISAVEQMRYQRNEHFDDSDEEIKELKQRIRLRRRQKIKEMLLSCMPSNNDFDSGEIYSENSVSSDDIEDLEIDEACNMTDHHGVSMSMASLYSETDILQKPREAPDGASDILTAEGVALSLISKFNQKQLPKASDLEWLVSEEDAPQALLPIPKSFPISPDELIEQTHTPLRGTLEWAPPRPQIIFTLHSETNRKKLIAKQNYRCAGCGMKVAPQYSSKFRYCNYLGRYFCTGCHTNQLSLIPGHVLQKWEFKRYPVSNFAYRLLEQMFLDPLFRAYEMNHSLSKVSQNFAICRKYRSGLFFMKDFILTCRFAETIRECLEHENSHVISDPEIYSMQDLVNVRSGEMKSRLKVLAEMCYRHILECELCLARGFICEICMVNEVLFPWQFRSVKRCSNCGTCFHITCWNIMRDHKCTRCQRLLKRKITRTNNLCDTPQDD